MVDKFNFYYFYTKQHTSVQALKNILAARVVNIWSAVNVLNPFDINFNFSNNLYLKLTIFYKINCGCIWKIYLLYEKYNTSRCDLVVLACKLMSRTFAGVRAQKCHLFVVTPVEVDVQPADILRSLGRRWSRHESEDLLAVFVPRYRIQILATKIVYALE